MSVQIIAKMKPKNNGEFALIDAHDVEFEDRERLDEKIEKVEGDIEAITGALEEQDTQLQDYSGRIIKLEEDSESVGEALNTKLDKIPDKAGLYNQNPDGTVSIATVAGNEARPWSVVQRIGGGAVLVGEPTAEKHATPKKYVDDLVANISVSGGGGKHTHLLTIDAIGIDYFTIKFEHPSATPLSFEELSGDMELYTRGLNVKFDGMLGMWRIVDVFKNNQIMLADTSEPEPCYDTMTLYATQEEAEEQSGAYILSYSVV